MRIKYIFVAFCFTLLCLTTSCNTSFSNGKLSEVDFSKELKINIEYKFEVVDAWYEPNLPEKELSELVGLDSVKQEVQKLVALMELQQIREARGFKTHNTSRHMVFTGKPGTGKTTTINAIIKILKSKGCLALLLCNE